MTQPNDDPAPVSPEAPAAPAAAPPGAPPPTADVPAAHWPSTPVSGAVPPPPTVSQLAAQAQRAAKSGDRRDLSRYLEMRRKR